MTQAEAREKFIARGKLEWQKGSIRAFLSRLSALSQIAPEIDTNPLVQHLFELEAKLDAKIAAEFPTTSTQRRSKKHVTRTPD